MTDRTNENYHAEYHASDLDAKYKRAKETRNFDLALEVLTGAKYLSGMYPENTVFVVLSGNAAALVRELR